MVNEAIKLAAEQDGVRRAVARHSPCVGVCKLDDASGRCLGCARTGDEIARWSGMSERERDAVWAELPARFAKSPVAVRLMPWTSDELGAWVARSISERLGTWVTGVPGALAEFPCSASRDILVSADSAAVTARVHDASFRLKLHDKLRAFAFSEGGPIVLGLPKARLALPVASGMTRLGPDRDAVSAEHRNHMLFDFAVGRRSYRFCVRTADEALIKILDQLAGRPWAGVMYEAGMQIFAVGPNRVVESALARIEVFAPIPLPGGTSPSGAHTHLLPEFLKAEDELPPGLALPDYAAPVAIFYPGGGLA